MNVRSYVFAITAAVLVLLVVIALLRQHKLRERHAVWWLAAGTIALLAGVFPRSLEHIANFVGIELPVNLVFFISIAILFLVSLQHSSELTTLESKVRTLAETVVLQQLRIDELTAEAAETETSVPTGETPTTPTAQGS